MACFCVPLVWIISLFKWHIDVDVSMFSNSTALSTDPMPSPIIPNAKALQWMLLLQLAFPLVIYALFLFICIRKTFVLPRVLYITAAVTLLWSTLACTAIYLANYNFW